MRAWQLTSPSPEGEGIEGWGRCAHLALPKAGCTYSPHPNPSPEGEGR
jgi:hypothetical protein